MKKISGEGDENRQPYLNQAVVWLRKAAEQGHIKAQISLGEMYEYGQGVEEDHQQAISWYTMAAEQGDADAQFHLGRLYQKFLRVPDHQSDLDVMHVQGTKFVPQSQHATVQPSTFEHRKESVHKTSNYEPLQKSVQVSSRKLVAAEEQLEDALAENEDSEYLDLLGHVKILQRTPKQVALECAEVERAAVYFNEPPTADYVSEIGDEEVTTTDLEYIVSDTIAFVGLDADSSWRNEVADLVKSSPEELHLTGYSDCLESRHGSEMVILSVSPLVAEEVKLTPQRAKITLCDALHDKVEPSYNTQVPVTATDDLWDVVTRQPLTPLGKSLPAHSESYYSNSDIQEFIDYIELHNPRESHILLVESQVNQPDSYEPGDDFFDNYEIPVDLDGLDFGPSEEFDVYQGDIDDEYAAFAFDPDDVYDSLDNSYSDVEELLDGKLSREERALQKAVELISRVDWSLSMLPLVQQIFVMSGWGATRLALEREIDKGMTQDELILAAHIKALWAENDYYWIAYDKNGSSNLSQYIISWPTALQLVRAFESLPQIEELEQFIETLFEYWYDRHSLHRAFNSFSRFLWFRIFNQQDVLPANLPFNFCSPHELPVEEYSDLGISDPLGIEHTAQLRDFGVFQTKHPQEPSCYASDRPVPVDAYSMATQTIKENSSDA